MTTQGTVAVILIEGRELLAIRHPQDTSRYTVQGRFQDVEHVRPLLVVDPDDFAQMNWLAKALVEAARYHGNIVVSDNGIAPETIGPILNERWNQLPGPVTVLSTGYDPSA